MKKLFILSITCLFYYGCGLTGFFVTEADINFDFNNHKSVFIIPPEQNNIPDKNIFKMVTDSLISRGYKIVYSRYDADLIIVCKIRGTSSDTYSTISTKSKSQIHGNVKDDDFDIYGLESKENLVKSTEHFTSIIMQFYYNNSLIWKGAAGMERIEFPGHEAKLLQKLLNLLGKSTIETQRIY